METQDSEVAELATTVHEDAHVAGYAELLDRAGADAPDAAEALRALADREGVPPPAVRGVPDPFTWLVERLRRRRPVGDHGTREVEVPWLEFHVPRGASGRLRWTRSNAGERGFTLTVLSAGAGSGRRISFSVDAEIAERKTCLRFLLGAQLQLRSYASGDGERLDADLVAFTNRTLVAWPDCPYCSTAAGEVDEFDYETGQLLDLSRYDAEYRETFRYELKGHSQLDLAVSLPAAIAPGTRLGLSVKREVEVTCEAAYAFPAGARFQPYWRLDQGGPGQALPYWAYA